VKRTVVSIGTRLLLGAISIAKKPKLKRQTRSAERWFIPVEMGWQQSVERRRFERCPGRGRR
jgi:hypothetical protein